MINSIKPYSIMTNRVLWRHSIVWALHWPPLGHWFESSFCLCLWDMSLTSTNSIQLNSIMTNTRSDKINNILIEHITMCYLLMCIFGYCQHLILFGNVCERCRSVIYFIIKDGFNSYDNCNDCVLCYKAVYKIVKQEIGEVKPLKWTNQ